MTTTIGSLDLNALNGLYSDSNQYFWFESNSSATYGAGAHVTLVPDTTFISNPTGQNILMNTDGFSIRNGLLPMMTLDNDSLDFNIVDTTAGTYTTTATFTATGVQIGQSSDTHSVIDANGQRFYNGTAQLANIGYGDGVDSTGSISVAPYYTFGRRLYTTSVYDSTTTYRIGDLCLYNDGEYVCITDITTPEEWNGEHWQYYIGNNSVVEGGGSSMINVGNVASGAGSHAEGRETKAIGYLSHTEGRKTKAIGESSHAEGEQTTSSGLVAHAEGLSTKASANYSHSQNVGTMAVKKAQTAIGTYNKEDTSTTTTHRNQDVDYGAYAFIVGNGSSTSDRSNALTIDWNGNVQPQSSILDRASTTAPSSTVNGAGFYANDKNGDYVARFTSSHNTSNNMGALITGAKEVSGTVKTNSFFVYLDASGNPHYWVTNSANFRADLSIQGALSTTSWTPSITRSSGGTVSSLAGRRYGNVVTLKFVLTYSTSVSAGSNAFVGKLTNSGYIPPFATFASTYYSGVPLVCQLESSGKITCRVTGSNAVTLSTGCTFGLTYIIA